jgi:hypothetical protein
MLMDYDHMTTRILGLVDHPDLGARARTLLVALEDGKKH